MLKKATRIASLAAIVIAASALTGCSLVPAINQAPVDDEPVAEAPVEDTAESADDASAAVPGELLQPGQTVAAGEWATYEFVNYDDAKAVLQTRLVGVETATQAQVDLLVSEIPELKGYHVELIRFETKKVSGDDIAYNSNYTDFRPADVNGLRAQEVSVISWDDCNSESFTEEFDAGVETIPGCLVGAWVEGGDPVGGMIWTGNSSVDDNPFGEYDGTPVFFQK
ncbi:hypothetical protein ET445_16295 [Agromyces protaetiae]|uniref:Uncharacterized protein n=1 Tax=Agromyces protaetiae TaxID=2509455 RepID=A0A4P6FJ86_9MICO|nr:hypothetical protein [Agromyces protaetiae]QAY74659.1 hypothetical protein ET445_16295 [Agromyces protaetiae]